MVGPLAPLHVVLRGCSLSCVCHVALYLCTSPAVWPAHCVSCRNTGWVSHRNGVKTSRTPTLMVCWQKLIVEYSPVAASQQREQQIFATAVWALTPALLLQLLWAVLKGRAAVHIKCGSVASTMLRPRTLAEEAASTPCMQALSSYLTGNLASPAYCSIGLHFADSGKRGPPSAPLLVFWNNFTGGIVFRLSLHMAPESCRAANFF